jgi:SnoaL-like domain
MHQMRRRKAHEGLDFEALRHAIEHCDLDAMLVFYSKEAQLSIVNADAPHALPFELSGKAEIAKHLRVAFGQKTSHRVERGVADENRVMFREACEYQDGSRIVVETTLEVRDDKIVRQVDVVASDARVHSREGCGRELPT